MRDSGTKAKRPGSEPRLFGARLLIGLLQGLALYLILDAALTHSSIATIPWLFSSVLVVTLFIPPALIVSFGRTRGVRLALWGATLAGLVVILCRHDAWRAAGMGINGVPQSGLAAVVYPSITVTFIAGLIVFTAYCLILAGEAARSWFAPYNTYFEVSWKLGLQVCLASLFVASVFLVLWLGAALFLLLQLHFLEDLLRQKWFNIPVGAAAFAAALHITDVRPEIIRGSRTLVLSLLSWLLLILVVIVGGFLVALPFAGLELLWATRSATWILLGVAAMKIIFVNAVFKGGPESGSNPTSSPEHAPYVLRICMRIACLMLPLLVTLAAYALVLRIAQYGFTPRRVLACAGTAVAYCYAIGYTRAALSRASTLAQIAPVNVLTTWVSLAVLIALFTPLADPARIAVASQVNRLLTGKIAPDKFDFYFLRYRSNRYGKEALIRLQQERQAPNAAIIRDLSMRPARGDAHAHLDEGAPDAAQLALNVVSRSLGQPVPPSFLSQDWKRTPQYWTLPACLKVSAQKCDAYLIDLTDEHTHNVVLVPNVGSRAYVFGKAEDKNGWKLVGQFSIAPDCMMVREALSTGTFQLLVPRLKDLQVNGQRVVIEPTPVLSAACGK